MWWPSQCKAKPGQAVVVIVQLLFVTRVLHKLKNFAIAKKSSQKNNFAQNVENYQQSLELRRIETLTINYSSKRAMWFINVRKKGVGDLGRTFDPLKFACITNKLCGKKFLKFYF
jgi:hypothetical protein